MEIHIERHRNKIITFLRKTQALFKYHSDKDFNSTDHLDVSTRTDLRSSTSKQIKQPQRNEIQRRKRCFLRRLSSQNVKIMNEIVRELSRVIFLSLS